MSNIPKIKFNKPKAKKPKRTSIIFSSILLDINRLIEQETYLRNCEIKVAIASAFPAVISVLAEKPYDLAFR